MVIFNYQFDFTALVEEEECTPEFRHSIRNILKIGRNVVIVVEQATDPTRFLFFF